ncbi:amidohydrolase family protein [Mesoterricola silvestris]|uniref:N-ethylammeline chlorohydrolase n=1 Tax=Mesoterricola silvestris TaxID=2927979 RepID=A0AA48GMI2_9BACT|nr:amidohydrolase family protein [Mesoterricola silvestris]BDU74049.1 N-ethylammeline chlorohydrolase [Mesoterricola silvestris]
MTEPNLLVCRCRFMLPLAAPDRSRRIQDGYVLAQGGEILEAGPYDPAVGRRLAETWGRRLRVLHTRREIPSDDPVPMQDMVLLPAFVKAHGHDHEQPLIGIARDEPLTAWLDHAVNSFTGFLNARKDELRERLGRTPQAVTYRMARLCDIHYGITASMVHHCNWNKFHLEDIAQANEAAGTTMIVAVGGQDRFYAKELLDAPGDALARLEKALAIQAGCERTRFVPGPDQCFSNSRAVLMPQKTWAREHGTLFHIHSSEEPRTTKWFTESIEPGLTPVEYFQEIGILDGGTVLAHQVNCGPRDIELIARSGAAVVHNPLANTILGSGMPPLIDMLKAGVPVAISTDGSGSADNQNILAAARLASQYQKALHQDATLLPSQQLLEMITVAPNRILRLNQGELAPGRQADWILLDLARPNLVPTRLDNVTENLLWAADGSEVDAVVAHGAVLKLDGQLLPWRDGTRPETILAQVQALSEWFAAYRAEAPEVTGTGAHG